MKDPTPFDEALPIALTLLARLEPACERIVVAGSIRRRQPEVGDIELVAIPAFEDEPDGLWGGTKPRNRLQTQIAALVGEGDLSVVSGGERYAKLTYGGMQVDLFMVSQPAQWGVILALRTGPAEYSQRLVARALALGMHVQGGALRWGPHRLPSRKPCSAPQRRRSRSRTMGRRPQGSWSTARA